MPNAFAQIVLLTSPIVFAVLFRLLPLKQAIVATFLTGYLLLPKLPRYDLPLLPEISKDTIPALMALVCSLLAVMVAGRRSATVGAARLSPDRSARWLPTHIVLRVLLALILLGAVGTVLTNGDAVAITDERVLPGLRPYDLFNVVSSAFISLLPFMLGHRFLSDREGQRVLLIGLGLAGFIYCLPALAEIRLSPNLNRWVYGFFPHAWKQHLRAGGYRPVVFLHHGLWLGIFLAMTALAAFSVRSFLRDIRGMAWFAAGVWIAGTLFLAKSLGALIILTALLPLALFATTRLKLLASGLIVVAILIYPMMRGAHLVPIDSIISAAGRIDEERAGSLKFRLDQEEVLLQKFSEKPLFGWGTWGRSFVYNNETGEKTTVTDSQWILIIGYFGWAGYIGWFGLLGGSVLLLAFRRRDIELNPETGALGLVVTANIVDLMFNATLVPVTWLVAGSVAGALVTAPRTAPDDAPAAEDRVPARPRRTGPPQKAVPPPGLAGAARGSAPAAQAVPGGGRYTRQTRLHHRKRQPVPRTR